jgi:D-alanyl-D-alanine carboxypeptidase
VRSAGFNDSTFVDATGLPHSDQLKTTERIRKIGGDAHLEDVVTIHDPVYYARDWQVRFTYNKQQKMRMMEYVCGEPHRDISKIGGVTEARVLNKTRAQAQ